MHGNVMHVDTNVFRAQGAKYLPSVYREFRQIDANRVQMPAGFTSVRTLGGISPGTARNAVV